MCFDFTLLKDFQATVKTLFKRLHRVFVHVYIHHFEALKELGLEAHVNQCYKHFHYFVLHFHLVEKKELEPLKEMSDNLCSKICPTEHWSGDRKNFPERKREKLYRFDTEMNRWPELDLVSTHFHQGRKKSKNRALRNNWICVPRRPHRQDIYIWFCVTLKI